MSPDTRKHRGAHPEDRKLFAEDQLPAIRAATNELSWLLTRDYKIKSALKLIGDKFGLNDRQRVAVSRAACSDQSKAHRQSSLVAQDCLRGEPIIIDGFNLIITIEAMLSRGVLLRCRDGCIRDLSSVHSSYRSVNETEAAIILIGEMLADLGAGRVEWLLDKPVSNSGRLANRIRSLAGERKWQWQVDVAFNPDHELVRSGRIVISSDGPLLDRAHKCVNLTELMVEKKVADVWLIDLSCS